MTLYKEVLFIMIKLKKMFLYGYIAFFVLLSVAAFLPARFRGALLLLMNRKARRR